MGDAGGGFPTEVENLDPFSKQSPYAQKTKQK